MRKSPNISTPLKISEVEAPKSAKNTERLSIVLDQSFFMSRGMNRQDAAQAASDFNVKMKVWANNSAEIVRLQAEYDITYGEAFELSKEAFIEFYERTGKQPQNFHVLSNDNTVQFMFQATDSYIKIDKKLAERLTKQYGKEIVQEKSVIKFDKELFEKHYTAIVAAIQGLNIPHTEKMKMLVKETSYEVKKGTIGELDKYTREGEGEVKLADVIEDIRPVFKIASLENV